MEAKKNKTEEWEGKKKKLKQIFLIILFDGALLLPDNIRQY